MRYVSILFLALSVIIISSCGGGGGGGGSPALPSISVNISSSDNAISVGDSISLSWSSSNASSCNASGSWNGTKSISGNETLTIDSSGSKTFTLTCSDLSSRSGSSSTTVDVGYPIAIGKLFHTNNSNIELFVDVNQDFIKNADEYSVTTSSDGSYELRNESETIAKCLERYPLVSDDGLMFNFLGTDYGNSSQEVASNAFKNINPFTSILSDPIGNNYDIYIGYEDSQNECGPLNSYMREDSWMYIVNRVWERIETYDGLSIGSLDDEIVIGAQRSEDIIKFQNSAKSIADSMKSELEDAITTLGYTDSSVKSHSELDTSNYRIFLNSSSYPNPSTDLSPSATSVDTIAAKAGVRIRTTIPSSDYMPGWDLDAFYDTWDVKISNNGDILSDMDGCYINFSSLCKQQPTLLNGITYGRFDLLEIYHKDTTRGKEKFIKEERIYDANSGACQEWDKQQISSEKSDRFLVQEFVEYRGESYYADLDCLTYDASSRGYTHSELFPDGTEYWVQVWDSYGDYFQVNNEMILDNYDNETPLPTQIPQEVVDVLIQFGNVYDNASSVDGLDSSPNPFNILIAFVYGDLAGLSEFQLLPRVTNGIEYYIRTQYSNNTSGYLDFFFANYTFYCGNAELTIESSLYDNNWQEQLQTCINILDRNNNPTSSATLKNISPYRGVIDE